MIKSLSLSKVASYGDQSEQFSELSKLNFIFGSNGTGKTTVSRIIANDGNHEDCSVDWADGIKLKALVYNRDFIDANFNQSTEIPGVFTLGEEDIEIQEKISKAKLEQEELEKETKTLKKTLNGDDGNSGKNGQLKELEIYLRNKCWTQKQKHDGKLKGAFERYRNNAENFKNKVIQEQKLKNNTATLVPLADLEKHAETIFGKTANREILIARINATDLIAYEKNPVLGKRVLGKTDVDIAGMIKKLSNSDWVRQGRSFYELNKGVCPFCQQDTNDNFAESLAEYFDETFEVDNKSISDLEENYKSEAARLQQKIAEIISNPSPFLNIDKLKLESQLLASTIAGNLQKLTSKKKEPSQLIELGTIVDVTNEINALIDVANANITQHNTTVDNITQERETLTAQVWKFVLTELETDLLDYEHQKRDLVSAITSLSTQISTKESAQNNKAQEIRELEKKITSIQPTTDDINALLKSFGFHGFSLAAVEGGQYYKLIRADGKDAKATLSEGERTFVTFLYFYHLLKGSNSESGITKNRVVVFDDPVSSLDSDILFIVSSLIKGLFDDIRNGKGYIKQIFVLTHNVYFHKEISFNRRRKDKALTEETFWIIRKDGLLSKVNRHDTNPIKTSYELLWADIKTPSSPNLTIQNTLRRIIENYFKIAGGTNLDNICEKFEGKSKLICKSLISWVHDGSHSAHDDLYVSNSEATVETYLQIFRAIFVESGHIAHYNMMMGEDCEVATI